MVRWFLICFCVSSHWSAVFVEVVVFGKSIRGEDTNQNMIVSASWMQSLFRGRQIVGNRSSSRLCKRCSRMIGCLRWNMFSWPAFVCTSAVRFRQRSLETRRGNLKMPEIPSETHSGHLYCASACSDLHWGHLPEDNYLLFPKHFFGEPRGDFPWRAQFTSHV